ncbi:preprotein translocase subunit SecG [bacterium]|nr:preprotein translocase subunit SecG [bacterium]
MSLLFFLFIFLYLGVAVLLSLLVMMQESKTLGLGASFGGDSSSSVFGSSTADVVKKITAYLAVAFFAGCMILTYWSHGLSKIPTAKPVEIESVEDVE